MFLKLKEYLPKYALPALVLLTGVSVLIPKIALTLLIIQVALGLALIVLQVSSLLIKPKNYVDKKQAPAREPFVSIHLTCHNEPSAVVMKTLNALARLEYSNYEVLVIDNNTSDEALWKPVQKLCEKLGPHFRFFHIENLRGFKAGALNVALQHMDPRAELMAIVDADYVVSPSFIKDSLPYFEDTSVALVQYPQDYSNTNHNNNGLKFEYQSFFSCILEQANVLNAVTVTGTMGILRTAPFIKNLEWNKWCITEDTEVGVQLYNLGYHGVFINRSQGQGLMPLDYYSFRRQRQRWAFGNMQIIMKDFWPIVQNSKLNWKQKWGLLAQLTAWFHPTLMPVVLLAISLIVGSFLTLPYLSWVSSGSVSFLLLFLLAKCIYFAVSLYRGQTFSWHALGRTMAAHFGLTATMSIAWLQALFIPHLTFNRTSKNPDEVQPRPIPQEAIWAGALIAAASTALVFSSSVALQLSAFGAIIFALVLIFAVHSTTKQLAATRQLARQAVSV
jgi:cellulose synthase/poly-beta-1,6-N-acetylglucosamine synthase-like glycosyltransferase